jgi:hypothetical protein
MNEKWVKMQQGETENNCVWPKGSLLKITGKRGGGCPFMSNRLHYIIPTLRYALNFKAHNL